MCKRLPHIFHNVRVSSRIILMITRTLYKIAQGINGVIRLSCAIFRKEIMIEELFWQRATNLWKMIHSIEDDLVYKVMWEDKLKELMKKYDF